MPFSPLGDAHRLGNIPFAWQCLNNGQLRCAMGTHATRWPYPLSDFNNMVTGAGTNIGVSGCLPLL